MQRQYALAENKSTFSYAGCIFGYYFVLSEVKVSKPQQQPYVQNWTRE